MTMPTGWRPDQPNIDIASEQVIWRNDVMTGIIHRKVVETQIITNRRVLQANQSVGLTDLDDIIVMNQHRKSERSGFYGRGAGYGTSRGRTIGDVVFMYRAQPVIIFTQIADPSGVCRLAKTARKSLLNLIKQTEKEQARIIAHQEKQIKQAQKLEPKQSKVTNHVTQIQTKKSDGAYIATIKKNNEANGITCLKCANNNPSNSNYCVICGSKLSNACSKCGNINPSGSAFCNKCGFTVA